MKYFSQSVLSGFLLCRASATDNRSSTMFLIIIIFLWINYYPAIRGVAHAWECWKMCSFRTLSFFVGHTRSVTRAYAWGLRVGHTQGIRDLGKTPNFMISRRRMHFVSFLWGTGRSQKDSNNNHYKMISLTNDLTQQWSHSAMISASLLASNDLTHQ